MSILIIHRGSMHGLIDKPKEWMIIGPGGMVLASFDDEEMARWYAENIVQRRGIDCRVEKRSEQ